MFYKLISLSILLAASTTATSATQPEENVVIISGIEEFNFVHGKNGTEIKHTQSLEYQATRRAEKIQPHIFHSNIITLDKASGGKAQYRNINSPTVFHDDSKICYFNIYLDRKDKKAKTQFKRTFTDGAHFTGIFPAEEYPIRSKHIIFRIPASLSGIYLVDRNFPTEGITRNEETTHDGTRIITYTVTSLPKIPDDENRPSALSSLAHIMVQGYFPDCDSLYRYHKPMLDVDTVIPGINSIITELTDGTKDRDEIIGSIYRYVQQTIRYVAFEAGEAAYRPDSPSEVLRKRYGDCKGMSLLLATLLKRAGIEAYIAIVGTDDIPFRIADAPSLAATNHMICIVPDNKSYLFLDPTHEQISAHHVPEWLCGKDAIMFTPEGYRMIDIPATSPLASEDIITYSYHLTPDGLSGIALRKCTEDMAESFMRAYSEVPGQHLNELLAKAIIPMQRASVIPDSIKYDTGTPGQISITAPILNQSAVTSADDIVYLDLNTSGEPFTSRIDEDDRKSDYSFPIKGRVMRRSTVILPNGAAVTIPPGYRYESPQASFSCSFTQEGNAVSMVKTIQLHNKRLPLDEIPAWNKAVTNWKNACNQLVEVKLKQ